MGTDPIGLLDEQALFRSCIHPRCGGEHRLHNLEAVDILHRTGLSETPEPQA